MRIRISKRNNELIDKINNLYGFKSTSIAPRIAFSKSIIDNKRFDLEVDSLPPSDGMDFRDEKGLFGMINGQTAFVLYKSILDQHYKKYLLESEMESLFKLHIDYGLEVINQDIENKNIAAGLHISYLMSLVKRGISVINSSQTSFFTRENKVASLDSFNGLVQFHIGLDEANVPITVRLNDLKEFDSHHVAIAGMTGSGKTQLIKDILYQVSKGSDNKLKFIFFDYKGEGDPENIKDFLKETNCEFIDILKDRFELNPMSFISSRDENERNFQINSFVDSISAIETSIRSKQQHTLKTVIRNFFDENPNKIPTVEAIYEAIQEYYEINKEKPDTLISILDKLSSGLFNNEPVAEKKIYNKSIYLNLPITLSDTLRQLIVFLTLKYFLAEFSKVNDTNPDENRIKPLRYVIVVDEAHIYLKNKNASKALEDLLRVIRSKGVVVIMLTQGIEDFKTKNFDFSSQIKIPICLNVKNKDYKLMKTFLGTPRSEHALKTAANKLDRGLGVVNFKEPKLITINQFWRTMEESKA